MSRSLCLIPAKGYSTRLPGKNMLPLNGKPMIVNSIEKALASAIFDEVSVSTEDEEIASAALSSKASVPFMRPKKLSKDPATIVNVMLHALEYYESNGEEFHKMCVLLPTAPFVTVDDIVTANNIFDINSANALLSVTPTEYPPFNTWIEDEANGQVFLSPCFPDSPYKYTKATECPATYRSNGAILIVDTKDFLKNRTYRTFPILPYIMPTERSLDIDIPIEYEFAKFLVDSKFFGRALKEV